MIQVLAGSEIIATFADRPSASKWAQRELNYGDTRRQELAVRVIPCAKGCATCTFTTQYVRRTV